MIPNFQLIFLPSAKRSVENLESWFEATTNIVLRDELLIVGFQLLLHQVFFAPFEIVARTNASAPERTRVRAYTQAHVQKYEVYLQDKNK